MGFSVTAGHVILLVALLGAASAASSHYWSTSERLDEARRVQAEHQAEVAQTNLTLASDPIWYAGNSTYLVFATNVGSTTLRVSELEFLVDGALATSFGTLDVDGDSSTDLWLPGETLAARILSVSSEPSRFALVAGNGAALYHQG